MAFVHTFVVAAIISAASPPTPAHTIAHRVMFRDSLKSFIAVAHSNNRDSRLDWTTDGCSAPIVGNSGRTFDFTQACHRHDFGYRNFKTLHNGKWWTPQLRHRIDRVFLTDMNQDCAARTKSTKRFCRAWARTYFRIVRAYGGP